MKYQNKSSKNSFSSYSNNYNSYDSQKKYKFKSEKKTKIKFDFDDHYGYRYGSGFSFYPSYVYNRIYADIFYPYNRYYSYNYNGYYMRPNYYDTNYRESYTPQNDNSGNNQKTEFNSVNLPSEYNPAHWVPSYQPYFDREAYKEKINKDLKSVKIFSQCCQIFCIVLIKNPNEGITSNKKRVFFEVILKNYAFFDSMLIDGSKKKCLIENILTSKDVSKLATENIFKKCNVDSPYESLPLKNACIKTMNSHCEKSGFNDLIMSSTSYISSSEEQTAKNCEALTDCTKLSTEEGIDEVSKKKCGGKLLNLFSQNMMKPKFGSFNSPCEIKDENTKTTFIEVRQTPKTTSVYVDLKDPLVKENVNKISNIEYLQLK